MAETEWGRKVSGQEITDILKSDRPVIIMFWARWCGPCRAQMPVMRALPQNIKDGTDYVILDVDDSPETAKEFGVGAIPYILIFKNGRKVDEIVGISLLEEANSKIHAALE